MSAIRESGDTCVKWPAGRAVARPASRRYTDTPVIVLAGDLDSNTPLIAARKAASRFRGARLVRVPNVGHTPLATDATGCVGSIVAGFVEKTRIPPTTCLRRISPVAVR
jgi:pimeloyl-ACP methyl ester carboxylesterase